MSKFVSLKSAPWVEFGYGSTERLGEVLGTTGIARWFVVYDSGVSDLVPRALRAVRPSLICGLWEHRGGEPTISDLERAREALRLGDGTGVIGIGGGAAMDLAKGVAVLAGNVDPAGNFQGPPRRIGGGVASVLIPTTAGSGSESTWSAVFVNDETNVKRGINGPDVMAHAAILDPELTLDLPPLVTAFSGADALTHAIESYVSKNANDFSEACALRAMKLIFRSLTVAVTEGRRDSRADMLMASHLAGRAIANSEVGLAHALSYPLSRVASVPHGWGNAILVPMTTRYCLEGAAEKYAVIAELVGVRSGAGDLPAYLEELMRSIGIGGLKDTFDLTQVDWSTIADEALLLEGPLANSPVRIDKQAALDIYKAMP